jgi:hypothetical protein
MEPLEGCIVWGSWELKWKFPLKWVARFLGDKLGMFRAVLTPAVVPLAVMEIQRLRGAGFFERHETLVDKDIQLAFVA